MRFIQAGPSLVRMLLTCAALAALAALGSSASAELQPPLRSAAATVLEGGGVLVQWDTSRERDTLGFHVWRESGSERVRLTQEMLAGSALRARKDPRLARGHVYAWQDPAGNVGVNYWIEEIEGSGGRAWHGPVAPVTPVSAPRAARSSPIVLSQIGNGPQAAPTKPVRRRHRHDASPTERLAVQAALAANPAVKILVREEGWYRVTQPELVAAGLDPAADPRTLKVFADGVEQPIAVEGVVRGRFGPAAAVEFYATGMDTPWTDARTYWLTWGGKSGQRIPVQQARGGTGPAPASFPFTIERKERVLYVASILNGEASNMFGPVVAADPVTQELPVAHLDAASPVAPTLAVRLQGVTDGAHLVPVWLNGVEVGRLAFAGPSLEQLEVALPPGLLREGENQVVLAALAGEDDICLLESIRLTYRHGYTAEADALRFGAPAGKPVRVDGFSGPRIRVMDITAPDAITELAGTIEASGAGFAVRVAPKGKGERMLLAFAETAVAGPAAVLAHRPATWHRAGPGADLVIITHAAFEKQLAPLAALRQRQGLAVAVVDVQALYDAYSFGAKDPAAIKAFFAQARERWTRPPRFALLVGGASADPRNFLGLGEMDYVPTKLLDTAFLETASDDWFVDQDGDGLPEIAIGRLPVRTAVELDAALGKLLAYEAAGPSEPWTQQSVFVADAHDGWFDFDAASAAVAGGLPADRQVERISIGAIGFGAARARLLARWNEGVGLVHFMGHGSVGNWVPEGLFTTEDTDGLTNGSRLPFVVGMTCLGGLFHDPYTESLAAALLTAEQGGAVAVWTSSGLTYPEEQLPMAGAMASSLYSGLTVGEAAVQAKAATTSMDVRRTWLLFGDPSLRLK